MKNIKITEGLNIKKLGLIILFGIFFVSGSVNAQTSTTSSATTTTTTNATSTSTTSTTSVSGCVNTSGYSTTTGQMCNGMGNPSTAMSTTTNTANTGAFPIGCFSYNGFSPITGESCMSMLYTTTSSTTTPNNTNNNNNTGTTNTSNPINVNIPLCEISRSLRIGSRGEDVRCLQRFLNYSGYTIASNGAGSPGNESTYYGSATASAVTRWQNANSSQVLAPFNLSSGTGLFGSGSFSYYVTLVVNAFRGVNTGTTTTNQ